MSCYFTVYAHFIEREMWPVSSTNSEKCVRSREVWGSKFLPLSKDDAK